MPLRAIINGVDVIASFMTDDEWSQLKQRIKAEKLDVRMPCCGAQAHLRTSKYGVHHFYHKKKGDCTSPPETWQHLKAKQEIVLACREAGYDARTEVEGEGWRADVLAEKGNARIAFEVQWSPQSWEVTKQRQQKFKDAGVRGCWFFKRLPDYYYPTGDVPSFALHVTTDACTVIFYTDDASQEIPLSQFISLLLNSKLRFCDQFRAAPAQDVEIKLMPYPCWTCGVFYYVYQVTNRFTTGCGQEMYYEDYFNNPESDVYFAFHPEVKRAVKRYATSKGIELGHFTRYRRKSSGIRLNAFKCPHCDALLGHNYLMEVYYSDRVYASMPVITAMIPIHFKNPPVIREELDGYFPQSHWCFPDDGAFCCEVATM